MIIIDVDCSCRLSGLDDQIVLTAQREGHRVRDVVSVEPCFRIGHPDVGRAYRRCIAVIKNRRGTAVLGGNSGPLAHVDSVCSHRLIKIIGRKAGNAQNDAAVVGRTVRVRQLQGKRLPANSAGRDIPADIEIILFVQSLACQDIPHIRRDTGDRAVNIAVIDVAGFFDFCRVRLPVLLREVGLGVDIRADLVTDAGNLIIVRGCQVHRGAQPFGITVQARCVSIKT